MTEEATPETENALTTASENIITPVNETIPSPAPENIITPVKYASFEVRIIAAAIDLFIVMLFAAPIIEWSMSALFNPIDYNALAASLGSSDDLVKTPMKFVPILWQVSKQQHIIERSVLDNGLQLLFIGLYTLPLWFRYASTPGKMLLRLEIQDATTFERLTHSQAIKRFLGYIVSFIPLSLGFLWIVFNKKRQGFHDKIANTIVIVKPKAPKKPKETVNQIAENK